MAALSVPFAAVTLTGVPAANANTVTIGLTTISGDLSPASTVTGYSSYYETTSARPGEAALSAPAAGLTGDGTAATAAGPSGPGTALGHLTLAQLLTSAERAGRGPAVAALTSLSGLGVPAPTDRAHVTLPGQIATFGNTPRASVAGSHQLVGIAIAPGGGYWAINNQGEVFNFGGAPHLGSLPHGHKLGPVVGIFSSPRGEGYWAVTRRGAVFPFGDAVFYGSPSEAVTGSAVVGLAPTPSGRGYWLATAKGKVFAFGDAKLYGVDAHGQPRHDVIGIAASPSGHGYWLATADGKVFNYGDAKYFGSAAASHEVITAIAASAPGEGYWLVSAGGHVHAFGQAVDMGSAVLAPGVRASAIASTRSGLGYVVATVDSPADDVHVDVSPLRSAEKSVRKLAQRQKAMTLEETPRATVATRRAAHTGGSAERPAAPSTTTTEPAMSYLGDFMVTCYDNYGETASGAMAGPSSVAVDPHIIPLGTEIYVAGVGERTADDTGGAIIGDHVDIWEPTYAQCADWGVQTRPVYRVNG